MSYEGYEEYLTKSGVYFTIDCYDDKENYKHIFENDPIEWVNFVDQTNGEGVRGEKEQTEHRDIWMYDHYGTAYAVLDTLYKPAPNSSWQPYNRKEF